MTQLYTAGLTILSQLADALDQISEEDFRKPSPALSNATIGQHLRHTLEFFICLEQGYEKGVVNYDKRLHDKAIERDKFVALGIIRNILDFVLQKPANKPMILEVGYRPDSEEYVSVETNFMRELTYNIEHAVHHMAIIKIGIREVAPFTVIPQSFGVAVSTLRYREDTAVST